MTAEICDLCGGEVRVGDWPFCHGDKSKHISARPSSCFFEPLVVYKDKNGRIRIPGNSQAKPPKGWQKVEINTRREAEAVTKEMAGRDRARWAELRQREAAFFESEFGKNRAEVEKLRHGVSDEKVREFIDIAIKRGDESDRKSRSYDAGVYWGVLE